MEKFKGFEWLKHEKALKNTDLKPLIDFLKYISKEGEKKGKIENKDYQEKKRAIEARDIDFVKTCPLNALYCVAKAGWIEGAEILIERGASLIDEYAGNQTPLYSAVVNGQREFFWHFYEKDDGTIEKYLKNKSARDFLEGII